MTTTKDTNTATATATTTTTTKRIADDAPSPPSPARALERVDADVSKQVRDKAHESSTVALNLMNDAARSLARCEEGTVSAFKKAKKATRAGAQVRVRVGDADYMARSDKSLMIIRDKSKHLIVGIRERVERAVHAVEVRVNSKDEDDE